LIEQTDPDGQLRSDAHGGRSPQEVLPGIQIPPPAASVPQTQSALELLHGTKVEHVAPVHSGCGVTHWPAVQVAPVGQTLPQPPQLFGSVWKLITATHAPLQSVNPVLQTKPHVPPTHVAVALGGVGHGVQDVPQVAGLVLLTQTPPQLWNPALQAMPQVPLTHVAVPFVGVGQT
jgi:hypothetical protein